MSKKSTSPTNSKRGCLCKDGETYSKECCEGEIINQGIGTTEIGSISIIENIINERTIVTEN